MILGVACLLLGQADRPVSRRRDSGVLSGVRFLKSRATSLGAGESAMMALAMIKAEVPASDPSLAACLAKVRSRFSSSEYAPERTNGQGAYEAGTRGWSWPASTLWRAARNWR